MIQPVSPKIFSNSFTGSRDVFVIISRFLLYPFFNFLFFRLVDLYYWWMRIGVFFENSTFSLIILNFDSVKNSYARLQRSDLQGNVPWCPSQVRLRL